MEKIQLFAKTSHQNKIVMVMMESVARGSQNNISNRLFFHLKINFYKKIVSGKFCLQFLMDLSVHHGRAKII